MNRARLLLAFLPLLGVSCIAVASAEPWAPLRMKLDDDAARSQSEVFVYVDGDYCGNFVDGKFVVYLTLEPHDLKVVAAGFDDWKQSVRLSPEEYPGGRAVLVQPTRAQ